MENRKIAFLTGPITSNLEGYHEEFRLGKRLAEKAGYIVLSPDVLPLGLTQADYMRITLAMLESADTIVALKGWSSSTGAQIEVAMAKKTGKRLLTLAQLCQEHHLLDSPDDAEVEA